MASKLFPMWVAFKSSGDLECWFGHQRQGYTPVGAVFKSSSLTYPLVFSVKDSQLLDAGFHCKIALKQSISFLLTTDQLGPQPVFSPGTPDSKLMTIFGELVQHILEISESIGLQVDAFYPTSKPGVFEMNFEFPEIQNRVEYWRLLGLFKASIEILACTRGFKACEFCLNGQALEEEL